MGLDLLDAPVRLTWDFPEEGSVDAGWLTAIAERVREAGVFFVTLQGNPLIHEPLPDILDLLDCCQCLLVCHGTEAELAVLERLPGFNGQLLLDVTTLHSPDMDFDLGSIASLVDRLRAPGYNPSLAMTPLRHNLANIPALIAFCSEHQIPKFKLPNAHIGDSFHGYSADALPDWQDLKEFSRLWSESTGNFEILPALEIHDLFLWEIMTPGQQQVRSEYGGCQAANSLAHLDINGTVHPCAAWPRPLGKLPEQSLEDIWAGSERHGVCAKIATTPEGCKGCSDLNICFGGCRGLAQQLNRPNGERDLMCSGPR